MTYFLSTDNDSHWYVVPTDKAADWSRFLDIDPDDERSWDVPEWARAVGGSPSNVKFENPVF